MNQGYLEDLLKCAKQLELNDANVQVADTLKMKASEALKFLFPRDLVLAVSVSHLNFNIPRRTTINGSSISNFSNFKESKSKLISVLEAKIDVLNHIKDDKPDSGIGLAITNSVFSNTTPNNKIPPDGNKELEREINELRKKVAVLNLQQEKLQQRHNSAIEQLQKYKSESVKILATNEKQKTVITNLKDLNNELINKNSKSKLIKWITDGGIITAIISIIGGAYFFGQERGSSKFDKEKITMDEMIKAQNIRIDSLRKLTQTNQTNTPKN